MKKKPATLVYLAAMLSIVPFLRPQALPSIVFLWVPKLIAGALSPILGIVGGLGALLGLARQDWKMMGAGMLAAGAATKFVTDIPSSEDGFEQVFGPGWQEQVPESLKPRMLPRRLSVLAPAPGATIWQQDIVYGKSPATDANLLADVWEPHLSTPRSGLGLVYVHGGGWRIGTKDMGTRPFFRQLAGQGHIVLDIAYTLWPDGDIPNMIREVKTAVLWFKENAATYGVDPDKIVVMGGSAGAHLALMTAYTSDHEAFQPVSPAADDSVCGVVAFYPPADFLAWQDQFGTDEPFSKAPGGSIAEAALTRLFAVGNESLEPEKKAGFQDMVAQMFGGTMEVIPETYRLLSPISHIGPHCPPTLILHGSDDVFRLTPAVRRFYQELQSAGVPSILVEFPHTEHAFDLIFPTISPVAQAANYDVERFLALLT